MKINIKKEKSVQALLKAAQKDPRVLAVILYGSLARNERTPRSDIDICLILRHSKHLFRELSLIKLNYLKRFSSLDIQIFQQLPLYIRQRVLKEGRVLLSKNEDKLYAVAFDFIREFADYEHIYRDYLNEVERGWPPADSI